MTEPRPAVDTSCFGFGPGWWNPWRVVTFTALVAVLLFTRLYDLGFKAIMHDESLFIYYTEYQIRREWSYLYQPILHGPALLWIQAILFHIFGVTDYTMRLAPALLGIGGFFWIWAMRRWLGPVGVFVALAFYVLSPSMMYYNRFYRNDGLYLFASLWIAASMFHWWHSRSPRWLASLVFAVVTLFCNKESSLFIYFSMVTFFLLLVVHDAAAGLLRRGARAIPEAAAVPRFVPVAVAALGAFVAATLVLTEVFEGISYEASVVSVLGKDFVLRDVRSIPKALGWQSSVADVGTLGEGSFWRAAYVALLLACFAAAAALKCAIELRWGRSAFLSRWWQAVHRARWYLLGSVAGGVALYLFLFTTGFKHPKGPFQIYQETLAYWMGQNAIHRIRGPFHMHVVNMLVYELPVVLAILGAWAVSTARVAWSRVTPVGLVLAGVALAVFDVLFFRGLQQPMIYFRVLTLFSFLLALAMIVRPRLGRWMFPAAIILFCGWSVTYFNSNAWGQYLTSPHARAVVVVDEETGEKAEAVEVRKDSGRQFLDDTLSLERGVHLWMIAFLVLVGTVLTWHAIDKGEKFHAYSIWWMITMIGAASYAREKMPQVGIHIAVPMILLLGVYGQKLATVGAFRRWRPLAVGVLALALAWQAKASVHLCFRNPGDVRERLVYGDTTPDLKAHVELVRRYQAVASVRHGLAPVRVPNRNPAYNPPEWMEWYNDKTRLKAVKVLAKQPDAIWPLRWYLRDVEWTEWLDVNRAIDERYPFMFLSVGDETRFPRLEQEYHLYRGRVRMHWTPPDINWDHLVSIWKNAIPAHYLDNTAQASGAYDSKQEWLKLWRYWWRREVYEGQGAAYTSLSTVEYLFAARKDLGPY